MHPAHRLAGAVSIVLAGAATQNHTVSPAAFTLTAGNTGIATPFFSSTHRYMQLHGDLRGPPLAMFGMALRRMAGPSEPSSSARTIVLECHMGPCTARNALPAFASNYTAAPTNVYLLKPTNLPDWTANQGSPSPWSVVLRHDAPYVHLGNADLAWEWRVHGTTLPGPYVADAYRSTVPDNVDRAFGNGCVASGNAAAMAIEVSTIYDLPSDSLRFTWTVTNGVAGARTAFLLGATNPNVAVLGLCTNLYSSGEAVLAVTAEGAGTAVLRNIAVVYQPSLLGTKLYAQGACPDSGRSTGLPFSATGGLETTIGARPVMIRRIWANDVNAAVGQVTEGYPFGLITRFTHQ